MWIAGGSSTAYSIDGINWLALTTPVGRVEAIAWNGSLWLAGGYSTNTLAYSTNGRTWTASASANQVFPRVFALAWNGYMWVAGGYIDPQNQLGASLAYSYDGITWTKSMSGATVFTEACYAVAWSGSLWVAGGGGTNRMAYSTDGINWTASTSGNARFSSQCLSVAWNGYLWVAGGGYSGGSLAYSTDGITWTAGTGSTVSSIGRGLAWNGSLWLAAGGGGGNNVVYSFNGINWITSTAAASFSTYGYSAAARRVLPNIGTAITRPVIQYGSGTSDGSTFTLAVTFTRPFAETPTITACVTNGSASWVSIGSASRTGFTAYTWNASGEVSVPLNWQAIL
jgi:hypothetical protein